MVIQWLSSKRVEGDDADKDTIPVNSLENGYSFTALDTPQEYIWNGIDTWVPLGGAAPGAGGWIEVGRTTLGAPASSIVVSGLPDKRYYMILADVNYVGTGTLVPRFQLNSDAGNNYADRSSGNGGADATNVTQPDSAVIMQTLETVGDRGFFYNYLSNFTTEDKLSILSSTDNDSGTGAGAIPNRREKVWKWANSASAVSSVTLINGGTGGANYSTGDELVVLGWDPADTHTDNFWEELATETLSTTDSNVQLLITPKKYLWISAYCIPTAPFVPSLRFDNVSTSTYSSRDAFNGGTDSTRINQTGIRIGESRSTPYFVNIFMINNSATEKLITGSNVMQQTVGAATVPDRVEMVGKYAQTSAPVAEIDFISSTSSYAAGSIFKVWGHD